MATVIALNYKNDNQGLNLIFDHQEHGAASMEQLVKAPNSQLRRFLGTTSENMEKHLLKELKTRSNLGFNNIPTMCPTMDAVDCAAVKAVAA